MENYALINNVLRVKESNTRLVLTAIRKSKTATRKEISKSTGLSISTCGNILKDLLATGEIMKADLQSHSGGRPAQRYVYNKAYHTIGSIIVSSEKSSYTIHYTIANLCTETIAENTFSGDSVHFSSLEALLAMICKRFPTLKAIGIGLPASLIHQLLQETSKKQVSELETFMSQKYKLAVRIEKSSAMTAMGYLKSHPDLSRKTIAAIIPSPHSVSAGYIFNDRIYKGDSYREGEFGFFSDKALLAEPLPQSSAVQKTIFAIIASIATFQPDVILLSKNETTALSLQEIRSLYNKAFPDKTSPELIILEDILSTSTLGTLDTAISSLQPDLTLVLN